MKVNTKQETLTWAERNFGEVYLGIFGMYSIIEQSQSNA